MLWYIMGSIIVFPCYAAIFSFPSFVNGIMDKTDPNYNGIEPNKNLQLFWYAFFPAIFNVGWASVQIATMSIVNSISQSNRRRDRLVNLRNGFTYGANITVLFVALILFHTVSN